MITNARDIINNADITTVIGNRTPLKPAGGGRLKANCPIHQGKGWSLSVDPDKNAWYCFSTCASGGGPLEFICALDSLDPKTDFREAVEILARETGQICQYDKPASPGNHSNGSDADADLKITREDLYTAAQAAADHYHANLRDPKNQHALEYAHSRGLSDQLIDQWQLGYARGDTVSESGPDPDHLVAAGILNRPKKDAKTNKLYDPQAGRLIIPMRNPAGRITSFAGRVIDGPGQSEDQSTHRRPKYINTRETPIYRKSDTLFGYHHARKLNAETVLILEGQLKVIAAQTAGIAAVSPAGTGFTTRQAAIAARLAPEALLAYDNDQAGHAAATRTIAIFRELEIPVQIATLDRPPGAPDGKLDPDDLLRANLRIKYAAEPWIDWKLRTLGIHPEHTIDPIDPVHAARLIHNEILPIIEHTPSAAIRAAERRQLAQISDIPEPALHLEKTPAEYTTAERPHNLRPGPDPASPIDTRMTPGRILAAAILQASTGPEHTQPTWWTDYIDWLHIPAQLVSTLQDIAHIKRAQARRQLTLATAITEAAPGPWLKTFQYWASYQLPGKPDETLIAQLTATLRSQARRARTQAAKHEIAENTQTLQRLQHAAEEENLGDPI